MRVPGEGRRSERRQAPEKGVGEAEGGVGRHQSPRGSCVSEEFLCPPQNSVALASIQLPPSLFSSLPASLAPPVSPDCTLQLLVFRNGRLFRSHGNTSRPGAVGPGKRRGVATPVIFAGTSKGMNSGYQVPNGTPPKCLSCAFILLFLTFQRPLTSWWRWPRMVAPHHLQGGWGTQTSHEERGWWGKGSEDTGLYIPDVSNFKRAISTNP